MTIFSVSSKTKTQVMKLLAFAAIVVVAQLSVPHSVALAADSVKPLEFAVANQPTMLSYEQLVNDDPLPKLVEEYLKSKGSPLHIYSADIIKQPRWEISLAVSRVESNLGQFCANNNCSGIGNAPGTSTWRKYPTKLEWFKDMSALMQKPLYSQKLTTCEKMRGVYVVPGSNNWVNGCKKTLSELNALTQKAEAMRAAKIAEANQAVHTASLKDVALAVK